MERSTSPIILGAITAIPVPAVFVCFLSVLIRIIFDIQAFGLSGMIFIGFGGIALFIHIIMFFYYLIKMQHLASIKQNHYLLWLLILMVLGGQLVFWYLYFWKTRH